MVLSWTLNTSMRKASSKTTVRNYLIKYGITIRESGISKHKKNIMYGKKIVKGKAVDNKKEQETISIIMDFHKEGLSNRAIARLLDSMRVPRKQNGKKWHHEVVRQIIIREKSIGLKNE